jgi:hypothetical protein
MAKPTMQRIKSFQKSLCRMLYLLSLGLFGLFVSLFGFSRGSGQAAGWFTETADKTAIGFGTHPIAGIFDFIWQAGRSIADSNSVPSTLLIVLIVSSIVSAFLTYFGIILLRIYKKDE